MFVSRTPPIVAAVITGTSGEWTDQTPAGITLDPDGTAAGPGNNFGVQGVVADPAHPGTFYATATYQGLFKSTDCGLTWAKVTTVGDDPASNGRSYLQMAPDGSYLLLTCLFPLGGYSNGAWKSTDGGVHWTLYLNGVNDDIGSFQIHPTNPLKVVASVHTAPYHLWESFDAGQAWTDQGTIDATMEAPNFVWIDDDHLLAISDGDTGDVGHTWLGTRSGGVWSWTSADTQQHWHGGSQAYVNGSEIVTSGPYGIRRSTDSGGSFSSVDSTYGGGVVALGTRLYSTANYASTAGFGPFLMKSTDLHGTSWSTDTEPGFMTNGWLLAARYTDGARWMLLGGFWNAGILRYVE